MATQAHCAPSDGQVLVALSGAMVSLFREFTGKGPDRCKAHRVGDDMILIVLGGGYTATERSLFAAGRGDAVQQARQALHETLREPMREEVEQLVGRRVVAVMSSCHQDPDLTAELFVLGPQTLRAA
jgi:uncharacterized protein YbcI